MTGTTTPGQGESMVPPASRLASIGILVVCIAGVVVSLALTVSEAMEAEAVAVGGVSHEVRNGVLFVEAAVTNHSEVDRCPDMRAVARDGEARDLAEVSATAVEGDGLLRPDETVTFTGRIEGLSDEELDEKLDDVTIYVYEPHRCDR